MTLWIAPLPCRNQLTAFALEKAELQSLLLCGTLVIAASVRHAKLFMPSGSLGVCDRFSGPALQCLCARVKGVDVSLLLMPKIRVGHGLFY